MEDLNIALLIDSDNVSPRYISGILSELSKYGKITIRRMYGDWSQDRLHSWMRCSSRFSLTPVMQPNNTPGKNASDIGLIIDAMDILYTGDVQGFCLVSSDGDFNKLATRLREAGKIVGVAVNSDANECPMTFDLSAFPQITANSAKVIRTSGPVNAGENWNEDIPAAPLQDKKLEVQLAPFSITTFVIE